MVAVKFPHGPWLTRLKRISVEDLGLNVLLLEYPGKGEFELAEGIRAVPLAMLFGGDFED